jgi:phospholipase/carboxylesterase
MSTHLLTRVESRPALKTSFTAGAFLTATLPHAARTYRTYLPAQYEAKYPYPLVVFFHPEGGTAEAAVSLAPKLSDRNLIAIGVESPRLAGGLTGTWDGSNLDDIEDDVVKAIEQTARQYHVHSERIYFAGIGDGARTAYRLGFRMADRIAGICALNGPYPTAEANRPLFQLPAARKLKVLISHGMQNLQCPVAQADRAFRLLYAAGTNVRYLKYATNRTISDDMLKDVNRWIIGNLNAETDQLILTR